jgi:DNA-binding GntR family transcriptional regulator
MIKGKESSLREQVYAYLKKRLNEGSLKPGSFLDLNALGAELGFSRTPLRDALLRLEAEGFVTIHARRASSSIRLKFLRYATHIRYSGLWKRLRSSRLPGHTPKMTHASWKA